MISNKKIACIIPARLESTRFPRKMLCNLLDKPLLQWVWEAATNTKMFDEVTFAVDSQEIASLIEKFNGKYIMTSVECNNGTERLIEVLKSGKINADIWVNWQGDEPFISKKMIEQLLQSTNSNDADVWTLKKKITDFSELTSPHFAKIVCNNAGYAMTFSRSCIPFIRDENQKNDSKFFKDLYFKHVGIYAYTTEALEKIALLKNKECLYEEAEKLEQLKFLYYGLSIKVHETDQNVKGIDLPTDLEIAEKIALANQFI